MGFHVEESTREEGAEVVAKQAMAKAKAWPEKIVQHINMSARSVALKTTLPLYVRNGPQESVSPTLTVTPATQKHQLTKMGTIPQTPNKNQTQHVTHLQNSRIFGRRNKQPVKGSEFVYVIHRSGKTATSYGMEY